MGSWVRWMHAFRHCEGDEHVCNWTYGLAGRTPTWAGRRNNEPKDGSYLSLPRGRQRPLRKALSEAKACESCKSEVYPGEGFAM